MLNMRPEHRAQRANCPAFVSLSHFFFPQSLSHSFESVSLSHFDIPLVIGPLIPVIQQRTTCFSSPRHAMERGPRGEDVSGKGRG